VTLHHHTGVVSPDKPRPDLPRSSGEKPTRRRGGGGQLRDESAKQGVETTTLKGRMNPILRDHESGLGEVICCPLRPPNLCGGAPDSGSLQYKRSSLKKEGNVKGGEGGRLLRRGP